MGGTLEFRGASPGHRWPRSEWRGDGQLRGGSPVCCHQGRVGEERSPARRKGIKGLSSYVQGLVAKCCCLGSSAVRTG